MLHCVLNEAHVRAAAEHPCAVLDTQPVTRRAARSGLNMFLQLLNDLGAQDAAAGARDAPCLT